MPQIDMFNDLRAAIRDDMTPDSADARIAARAAGWIYTRAVYRATWQAALTHALNVGDSERVEFCKERIAELKEIR